MQKIYILHVRKRSSMSELKVKVSFLCVCAYTHINICSYIKYQECMYIYACRFINIGKYRKI